MKNKKGTYRRLPNGYGSVTKLSGNRRRPYAARLSASGTADGQNTPRAIGYYETWQQAYEALAAYNRNPYDFDAKQITFAEVYELFLDRRKNAPGGLSKSSASGYTAAYKHSASLHERPFCQIKAMHLQKLLDGMSADYSKATLELVKNLWLLMWNYAEENEIVDKNLAKFVRINKEETDEHSVPLTQSELNMLWQNAERSECALVLIMCYSGFRVSAYQTLTINLEKRYFQGGVKTSAGRNRVVPIHSRIVPLVERLLAEKLLFGQSSTKIRSAFKIGLQLAGVELGNHTPHDARATLATELERAHVRDLHIKRILGHSTGDITKDVYTSVDVEELRQSIELIP